MHKSKDPFLMPQAEKFTKTEAAFVYGQEINETFSPGGNACLWIGKIISSSKHRLSFIFILLIFSVLIARLCYLQIFQGANLRALADSNRFRKEIIPASRGVIFDSQGIALVDNIPSFSLFLNTAELKSHQEEKLEIKNILIGSGLKDETSVDELFKSESYLPVAVAENLPYEQAINLQLRTKNINSLKIDIDSYRNYMNGENFCHLLGYLSRITPQDKDYYLKKGYRLTEKVGSYGLEEFYQNKLRGNDGMRLIEVDSLGREKSVIAEKSPESGNNLYLNIDSGLQNFIGDTLKKYIRNKAGVVIALNPNNGKVLGLVSWPAFDNNNFSRGISLTEYQKLIDNPLKPLYNRAISGEYPSGSTIKLIMSVAGLYEGVITRQTLVNSVGGVYYDKWFFPDWKAGGHGFTNVIKALADSVNTFFYYLALEDFDGHHGLGLKLMLKYFHDFGLGEKMGIDLFGEKTGFLPDPEWKVKTKGEAWYPGDTLHLAIGQGDLLVTPLQVAAFTAAVANEGTLFMPELVERIIDLTKGEDTIIEPKIIRGDLANKSVFNIVAEGLRAGVISGSSANLNNLPVAAAGKTGTAQAGENILPHAWFTGYIPYENPQITLTVLVENGGDGSSVAVPIAKDIFKWYIENRINK